MPTNCTNDLMLGRVEGPLWHINCHYSFTENIGCLAGVTRLSTSQAGSDICLQWVLK